MLALSCPLVFPPVMLQQMRVTVLLPLMFSALTCCPVLSLKLTELLQWYATTFRDPLMLQPPEWFKAFIYCEAFLQLPFFPIAAYAFLKGWCKASVGARPVRCCHAVPVFCAAGVEVWVSNGRGVPVERGPVLMACSI